MAMKFFSVVCLGCLGAGVRAASNDHPIGGVIKMLQGLKAKAIMDGKMEGVAYNKFAYWCKESIGALDRAIADEKEKISELKDLISGKEKDKEVLEDEIETLEKEIADREAAMKKAADDRKDEHDLYKKVSSDLELTIGAVDAALAAVESANAETEPGMLLAQRNVKQMLSLMSVYSSTTEVQLDQLQKFAGAAEPKKRPKQLAAGDLAAHEDKYEFKSGSVIELLKNLRTKFEDDKLQATKEETNALNSYELAKQAQEAAVAAAKGSKEKKDTSLAEVNSVLKESRETLEGVEADKEANDKGLSDTHEACTMKKGEWEERSEVRANEIEAMEMAVKILAKVSGVRTEVPSNPIPPAAPVEATFLQIASSSSPKMSAVALLKSVAQKTHSRALERLAVEVAAHLSGPFDQVNNMIEKMIFRLMDEQKQEDEHKNWCDQELEKSNTMKDDKEDKIKNLDAEIATQKAEVSKLSEEITAANEMIADIVKFKADATEVREVGKKENKLSVKDSEDAQRALAQAIAVLTDFYKESGEVAKEPWEFIQEPVKLPENPATWDSGYTAVADPKKAETGILSMLETVMADFAKVEAETHAQEASDQKEYEQAMSDNDIEMSRNQQESDMKTAEKKRRNGKIADLESSKKDTTAELEKTDQYLEDLKPACVNGDSSYDDRKAARAQEIEALHQAQGILTEAFAEKPEEEKKSFLQKKN